MYSVTLEDTGEIFQVGKILCIGRNYAKHAEEMGSSVPAEPMVFLKPSSALVASGRSILIPRLTQSVHHEVELVVLIGNQLKHAAADEAKAAIAGYAVGLDMTARDLQSAAKKSGSPWTVSKGFDTFAPLGTFVSASNIPDPQQLQVQLRVNGDVRQTGWTGHMIFPVVDLIVYCSTVFTLYPGDLLFTGTPEGVGEVAVGDLLYAEITGIPALQVDVRSE